MNDATFGRQVASLLDEGLDRVDETVATRLQVARKAALAHAASARSMHAMELASAGPAEHGRGGMGDWRAGPRLWLAIGLFAIAVSSVAFLDSGSDRESDAAADLDLAILADDLPVTAYIDDGFDKWLNRPVEPQQ